MHFCADGETIETIFAQLFLLISSVFTEQSQICVKNTKPCHVRTERPVMAGLSDPLFVPTSSLMKTPTPSTDDPAQEDRVERLSQQNRVIKIVLMQDF